MEETLFTWIHLADLHVGRADARDGARQAQVLETLRRDIASRPGPARVDWILVTGDVAGGGGTPGAYAQAAEWLISAAAAAQINPTWIWVVPGNHDVSREADGERHLARLLDGLRSGRDPLDAALEDADDRARLAGRLGPFLDFAAGFAPWSLEGSAPAADQRLFWMRKIKVAGTLRVRLVGLDTALLSTDGKDDAGALQVGHEQLAAALVPPIANEGELVVALSHHPLSTAWLADARQADGWLHGHAHVHLSGHAHDAGSAKLRAGSGGPLVHVVAGATGREKDGPRGLGYNFGEVVHDGEGGLELRVWPRRWSEADGRFDVDTDSLLQGRRFASHRLRARLPPAPPPQPEPAVAPPAHSPTQPPPAFASGAPPPTTETARVDIFYFHASKDEELLSDLEMHLALMEKRGIIAGFGRRSVETSAPAISFQVEAARVFLVLLSPSLLASGVLDSPELRRAVERAEAGEARLIPIYLERCDPEGTPVHEFEGLPRDGVAVTERDRREAFTDIAWELQRVIEYLDRQ